jgi:hypothetical protein
MISKIPSKPLLKGEVDFYDKLKEWDSTNTELVETRLTCDDLGLAAISPHLFFSYWTISDTVNREYSKGVHKCTREEPGSV